MRPVTIDAVKIAILSDIHGNLPALQATAVDIAAWRPDQVIVAGDVVNGCPHSLACWQFIRARQQTTGWHVLRGNHEDYVVEWLGTNGPFSGPEFELRRLSHVAFGQLGTESVGELAALAERWQWPAPDGSSLLVLHASLAGNRRGIYPWTDGEELQERLAPYPAVFVTAHTHIPFQRQVRETLLVNVGAVGLPGDGDWRASYGRLTWSADRGWHAALRRVPYDRPCTEEAFFADDFLVQSGPIALLTLVELRAARDAKTRWARQYRAAILSGDISVADSVRAFLAAPEFEPYLGGISWPA